MITELDPKLIQYLEGCSRDERVLFCRDAFPYFMVYYFAEYLTYDFADFHFDFFDDYEKLMLGILTEVAWIAFRESAKTSIGKIGAIDAIVYGKKRYINFDSYVKSNSESSLFDIVVELQTNKRLINDFGQLYYTKRANKAFSEAKLKRINSFITENGVKVEAFSTQESTRGRLYKNIRPDYFILDDFETSKTKISYPVTAKIIEHINEMKAGLGPNGSVLYEGNLITEDGVVAHIRNKMKGNPKAIFRNIPVVKDGVIAWPDKYVHTNKEAMELNKNIKNKAAVKISLEQKEQDLGSDVFQTEMMNDPSKTDDVVFDRHRIELLMKNCIKPKKNSAGLKTWADFNASHRYGIGGDTAEGEGGDSNALAVIDYHRKPALVVATYENNQIPPDAFAHELIRAARMYGECLIAPEINNTGFSTVTELVNNYDNNAIYVREEKNKTTGKPTKNYGFRTTTATKPDLIYQLKKAVENGDLEIFDKSLLEELKAYRRQDIKIINPVAGMTRHFDKLWACAIAWEMRYYAQPPQEMERIRAAGHQRRRAKNIKKDAGL